MAGFNDKLKKGNRRWRNEQWEGNDGINQDFRSYWLETRLKSKERKKLNEREKFILPGYNSTCAYREFNLLT